MRRLNKMPYSLRPYAFGLLGIVLFSVWNAHYAAAFPNGNKHSGKHCAINKSPDVVCLHPNEANLCLHMSQTDLIGVDYIDHVRAVTLPSGQTYRFVHYAPQTPTKPTILFLHGFPSSSFDWRHQFAYFSSRGYGIVAPDLLGYGGTSKPSNPEAYTLKRQASEVTELLDCVGVGKATVVGHDL